MTTLIYFMAAAAAAFLALPLWAAPEAARPERERALPAAAPLAGGCTAQLALPDAGLTDFDAFSAVSDPLYREGSKELLKRAVKQDEAARAAVKPALRDAPNSAPAGALKKPRAKKPVHADPVKGKNSL